MTLNLERINIEFKAASIVVKDYGVPIFTLKFRHIALMVSFVGDAHIIMIM